MTIQTLFRPSLCCEGLSAVQGHGFIDEPREDDWDWMECLSCKRTYFDYDSVDE